MIVFYLVCLRNFFLAPCCLHFYPGNICRDLVNILHTNCHTPHINLEILKLPFLISRFVSSNPEIAFFFKTGVFRIQIYVETKYKLYKDESAYYME